jgi:meso-butanediol dehydrogenase / (S,S)-butanediol dehydrogenase / diacetyl reductase
MQRVQNKVALVTGAASGIGLATARLLEVEGAWVISVDVAAGAGVRCDVTEETEVAGVLASIERIDILINCAGVAVRRPVYEENEADWDRVMAVNLKGSYLCSKHAIPRMVRGGSIVHTSSVTGITGVRNRAVYSASKGAIVALTRNMALDLAERGIRVNCVCPGFVRTPLLDGLLRDPERAAKVTAMHPLGRLGEPEDVARAILFLASDESSWITGHALVVDGGFSAGHSENI